MVKQADVDKIDNFTEKERKYYNLLLQYRDVIAGNMKSHAENALDASNADKRGVTTHMADVGADSSRNEMELQLMTEARLEAKPYAIYCVKCKSIREKNDGHNPYVD